MLFDIHTPALGRGAVRHAGHPHGHAAPAGGQQRRCTARVTPGIPGLEELAGVPVCGSAGRSAGRSVRPDLLRPRRGQEHLRHRLLHADERGRQRRCAAAAGLVTSVAWQRGRQDHLRPGGQRVQRRQHHPVAAGRAAADQLRAGDATGWRRAVPDSGGVVVVPAFTGLGAPYWDMYARGAIAGHHPGHRPGRTSPGPCWSASPIRSRI